MYYKSVIDNMMSLKIDISVFWLAYNVEQAEFDALVHVSVQPYASVGASSYWAWCILVDECRYGRLIVGLTVGDAIAFRDCVEKESDKVITVTDTAAAELRRLLADNEMADAKLRIFVQNECGCGKVNFGMGFDQQVEDNDQVS